MITTRKIKLVFVTQSLNTIVVEEIFNSENIENVVKDIIFSAKRDSFPSSNLELNVTINYPNLISIKTGDKVAIYISELDNEFVKMHSGTIFSVKVKSKLQKHELIIESCSSFYKLKNKKLNSANFKFKSGLREILKEIVNSSQIDEVIHVNNLVSNSFELGIFKNLPAMSLINIICYNLDLTYNFDRNGQMVIENRMDFINKVKTSIPFELNDNNIISTSFEQ